MAEPHLILASTSPRRRELLARLGLPFEVAPVDLDEAAMVARHAAEPAPELAARLAAAKARALDAGPDVLVLAADTLVVLGDRVLGKPRDAAEATAMLRSLRGREHAVATGIAVRGAGRTSTDVAVARAIMRWYGDAEIGRYVASGEPFDKAGGYAIQDADFAPVARLQGCHCAVVGLPLWRTARLLAGAGLRPGQPDLCPLATPAPTLRQALRDARRGTRAGESRYPYRR